MAEITVTKALLGEEDLSIGSGTFNRTTSTGATQAITKIGLETFSGAVNVTDYNATGDGITDDAAEIQAAIDSITTASGSAQVGGTVIIPPGTYLLGTAIDVPNGVSVIGIGRPVLKAGAALAYVLGVDESNAFGNRGGVIANLFIDGDSTADTGLFVGLAVQRHFENISCENCVDAGCEITDAQNCTFLGLDCESNGAVGSTYGAGLRLNGGAGNNVFIRCENNLNLPYQGILMGVGTTHGFTAGPSGNSFYNCIFERVRGTDGTHQLYIRSGRYNSFYNCNVASGTVTEAITLVQITQDEKDGGEAGASTGPTRIIGGSCTGNGTYTTGIKVISTGATTQTVDVDGVFFENHLVALNCDASCQLHVGPQNTLGGGIGTKFSGAGAVDTVVAALAPVYKVTTKRAATTDMAMQVLTDADSNPRWRILASGSQAWGPGNAALDVDLYRATLPSGVAILRSDDYIHSAVGLVLTDGVTPPATESGYATIYVDTTGGDLKVIFGDGVTKTLTADNAATGTATPAGSVTPDYVGQIYVDTTADIAYVAVGTTNADWDQISN